jgi:hypothetical protein
MSFGDTQVIMTLYQVFLSRASSSVKPTQLTWYHSVGFGQFDASQAIITPWLVLRQIQYSVVSQSFLVPS